MQPLPRDVRVGFKYPQERTKHKHMEYQQVVRTTTSSQSPSRYGVGTIKERTHKRRNNAARVEMRENHSSKSAVKGKEKNRNTETVGRNRHHCSQSQHISRAFAPKCQSLIGACSPVV